jgi:hypothetical protein
MAQAFCPSTARTGALRFQFLLLNTFHFLTHFLTLTSSWATVKSLYCSNIRNYRANQAPVAMDLK